MFKGFFRRHGRALIVHIFERIKRIEFLFLTLTGKGGEQREPVAPDLLAPAVIAYGVLQDAVEQERQFFRGLVAILFCKLDHRILNHIEGRMAVMHRKHRMLVGAAFYAVKKIVQFGLGCQFFLLCLEKF